MRTLRQNRSSPIGFGRARAGHLVDPGGDLEPDLGGDDLEPGDRDLRCRAVAPPRQLLAFSRKQTMRPVVLDLGEALSDLTVLLKRLIGENITLNVPQVQRPLAGQGRRPTSSSRW